MASSSEDISGASATQTAVTEDGNEILIWRFADDNRKLLNFHHFENNLLNDILNWYLPSLLMCNFMVTWFHRL